MVTSNNENATKGNEMMTIALILNGAVLALLMFVIIVGILDGR